MQDTGIYLDASTCDKQSSQYSYAVKTQHVKLFLVEELLIVCVSVSTASLYKLANIVKLK